LRELFKQRAGVSSKSHDFFENFLFLLSAGFKSGDSADAANRQGIGSESYFNEAGRMNAGAAFYHANSAPNCLHLFISRGDGE
jgi:hypothetical protein